jgi:hypothetical protein
MALNKKLTAGPKVVAYYEHYWHRLTWKRVDGDREWWQIFYRDKHVGEFFEAKGGKRWFGVLFGRFTMWRRDKEEVLHTLTACVVGPQH